MVNSGLAPFPTQNPNFPPEAEPKRPPKTTLTGRAQQQYEEKWFNDQKKANKAKTERGDETCKSRCHHCATCFKPYRFLCRARGHMIQCRIHPSNNFKPGKTCVECDAEEDADDREIKKAADEEKKVLEKAKADAWLKDGAKAKKAKRQKPGKPRQAGKK